MPRVVARFAPPALAVALALSCAARLALAQGPLPVTRRADAVSIVRALGPNAAAAFAPRGAPGVGALARLPAGVHGADWGIQEVAPGIGRLWGQPADIVAFADAHPTAPIEVVPPLRPLLDTASIITRAGAALPLGFDGEGVLVGLADTGIDVTHRDFIDAAGHSRVAWLLDLSAPPRGVHAVLEWLFGSKDSSGNVKFGAVWSGAEIDAAMAAQGAAVPGDPAGHGTLVASCAAGNGEGGQSRYRGMAPRAGLLVARITDASEETIGNDELLRGVAFLMNRADALALPVVVNLSIGTDFGPHDGTMLWEQTLASYVGPTHPGRAIVVAAGNSGDIANAPIHQQVHVSSGTTMRIPISTDGATSGGVQVWVAIHGGASLSVGLDDPRGTWVEPVAPGQSAGSDDHNAGIYNGSEPKVKGSLVPAQSNGAVVVWQGAWASGTFYVTLSGTGTADLFLQATGDASIPGVASVSFADGVREGTIGLPATHPALIGVGCTVNKPSWTDVKNNSVPVPVPLLDDAGASVVPGNRGLLAGEPCWFSGAGPTLTGVLKPDIMAPGAAIVGALSAQAVPPAPASIFTNPTCRSFDPSCQQVDATHGAALGTSFSSPVVAGIVALLLQRDKTLTQDRVLAALQGGAHPLRGKAPFDDQAGPGEVDAMGALLAVDMLDTPRTTLPVRATSWMTLGAEDYLADGTTPIEAVLQLRAPPTVSTQGLPAVALPADGFEAGRLKAYALIDGVVAKGVMAAPVQRGPGVWLVRGQPTGGQGGSLLTIGVTFDGADIVAPRTIPIATDSWSAVYAPSLQGGCSAASARPERGAWIPPGLVLSWLLLASGARRAGRMAAAQRRRRRCSR